MIGFMPGSGPVPLRFALSVAALAAALDAQAAAAEEVEGQTMEVNGVPLEHVEQGSGQVVLPGLRLDAPAATAEERCDIALSLALDLSASTKGKHDLVTDGTAAALRNPAVLQALAGQNAMMQAYAFGDRTDELAAWTQIGTADDLFDVAAAIENAQPKGIGFRHVTVRCRSGRPTGSGTRRLRPRGRGLRDRRRRRQPISIGAEVRPGFPDYQRSVGRGFG